ncbi:MobF family relaxase [Rothia terrae]|uniref:AAA family ATPase n=1 Tax=Rothia terrae TaxID=396015 RepID=A0A7S6WWI7_9MICC|nr:MobF family relaxase [Rothia terrae]QOW64789.1 AAA family ATPase [Rothia terrae]
MTFFHGTTGKAVRQYLEKDRTASTYYLENGESLATNYTYNHHGEITDIKLLDGDAYERLIDGRDPVTGELRGRAMGDKSTRFIDKPVNISKSLSLVAEINPQVGFALDQAMNQTVEALGSYLAQNTHVRVRVGNGERIWCTPDQLEIATAAHRTSRDGDPHRHIHVHLINKARLGDTWYALDTSEVRRLNKVLNAVGERVIHADENLNRVLAQQGYSFDPATGEIAEVAAYTQGFSQRAAAIAARRTELLADWQDKHPGISPGRALLNQIDYQAWSQTRAVKSSETTADTDRWLAELEQLGFVAPQPRLSVESKPRLDQLNLAAGELGAAVVGDVSAQKSSWSVADLTAGAYERLSHYDFVASRDELAEFVAHSVQAAKQYCEPVVAGVEVSQLPHHLKVYTSQDVVEEEAELRQHLAALGASAPAQQVLVGLRLKKVVGDMPQEFIDGVFASGEYVDPVGESVKPPVNDAHARALQMMSGSARLVSVTGPAGAGKTSLLKAAKVMVEVKGGRQMIVAPSGKAADVARQETGSQSGTVHQLLHAYGFTQTQDPVTGERIWGERLVVGDAGYSPVPRAWALGSLDQVIVDEASMMSQDTAVRLVQVARETGAQLVLTGDYAQLSAVGRGGVLSLAQAAGVSVDLDSVYRFRAADGGVDTGYADLSLLMRSRKDAGAVFDALVERGLVQVHGSVEDAHVALASAWVDATGAGRCAVVSATTNEDATSVNTLVAGLRATGGVRPSASESLVAVDDSSDVSSAAGALTGMDGIGIRVGDTVMARKNDHDLGVLNRQSFRVLETTESFVRVQSVSDSRRQLSLPVEYVREHVQAGYAVTTHGAQGMTVDEAHTLVTGACDGAGVYVGLSRGRFSNVAHFVATDLEDAREQFIAAMSVDRADQGLEAARTQLGQELKQLGVYPRERADHRVKVCQLRAGDGVVVAKNAGDRGEYVVLESTADENNKYLMRLHEVGGSGTRLMVGDGQSTMRFTGAKVLPVTDEGRGQVKKISARMNQRAQAQTYVHKVNEWAQENQPVLERLGAVKMLLSAHESGLESARKELRAVEAKYFEPMFSYKTELSNATGAVRDAQQELEQAGIFRRRGARVRLEQAQQRLDEVQAAGSPDQGQIQALQEKVGHLAGLVEVTRGEHEGLYQQVKASMPAKPRMGNVYRYVTGSGVRADGSVDVRLVAGFDQGVAKDCEAVVQVLSVDPVSRAGARLSQVQQEQAVRERSARQQVDDASYHRFQQMGGPSRGAGPSLGF